MNKDDNDTGVSSSPDRIAHSTGVQSAGCDTENSLADDLADDATAEARVALRRRVLKTGQISINQDYAEIPCRIRNISQNGALVEVAEKYIVPDIFTLSIPMDGFSVKCQVVRRQSPNIGLEFIGEKQKLELSKSQSIRSSSDPYLDRLIRQEKEVITPLTDTQKAIRRTSNQPAMRNNGFGKRGT